MTDMTNRQQLQHVLNARIAPCIPKRAWDSTVTVVVADRPNVRQLGTATLFQVADARFVVTAAHVLQGASDADRTVGISGGPDGHFVALGGTCIRSAAPPDGSPDPYDLAVYRLPADVASRLSENRWLRLSDLQLDAPGPRAVYTLFGFPGVWTTPSTSDNEPLSAKPLEFTTYAYDGSLGAIQHHNPDLHILLSATADNLTRPDGAPLQFRDRYGQIARLPIGLKGISGCSVWHIGDLDVPIELWAERYAKLAGVACAVYQAHGAVKVTRWIAVTTLIHAAFPDLQQVLKLSL